MMLVSGQNHWKIVHLNIKSMSIHLIAIIIWLTSIIMRVITTTMWLIAKIMLIAMVMRVISIVMWVILVVICLIVMIMCLVAMIMSLIAMAMSHMTHLRVLRSYVTKNANLVPVLLILKKQVKIQMTLIESIASKVTIPKTRLSDITILTM